MRRAERRRREREVGERGCAGEKKVWEERDGEVRERALWRGRRENLSFENVAAFWCTYELCICCDFFFFFFGSFFVLMNENCFVSVGNFFSGLCCNFLI